MSLRRAALAMASAALMLSSFSYAAQAADPAPTLKTAPEEKPIIKKFDIWSTSCIQDQKTKALSNCHAFVGVQAGAKDEEKRQVLYLGIGYVPNKGSDMFMFAMTPLGTILPPGVGVDVDDKVKFGAPFAFCIPRGCQAEQKLTDEQLKAMKSGKQVEILFRLLGQGVVKIPIDLKGFGAAVKSLPKPAATPTKK